MFRSACDLLFEADRSCASRVTQFVRQDRVLGVWFDLVMSNGWQMPGQTPSGTGESQWSTGRAQICAVPPLQSKTAVKRPFRPERWEGLWRVCRPIVCQQIADGPKDRKQRWTAVDATPLAHRPRGRGSSSRSPARSQPSAGGADSDPGAAESLGLSVVG